MFLLLCDVDFKKEQISDVMEKRFSAGSQEVGRPRQGEKGQHSNEEITRSSQRKGQAKKTRATTVRKVLADMPTNQHTFKLTTNAKKEAWFTEERSQVWCPCNGACACTTLFTPFCHLVQSFCGLSLWVASQNGFHWILEILERTV